MSSEEFFGDKFVIRSWIHTFATLTGKRAGRNILFGLSLNGAACTGFEQTDYQPSKDGLIRQQVTI
jgi:hypothetical protein